MGVVPSVPRVVKRFARPFAASGFQCWLVGGAVRDLFIRRSGGDYDLATDARPEQVRALYRHAIPTGVQHGTVTVPYSGRHIEVTTFRSESDYRDGRRPALVSFTSSIEEDLSRRDFTINGIAMEVPGGRIVDPFGGRADLERRLIRAIGDAAQRFAEDGLRPLRACRFAAQLGFQVDGPTRDAIRPSLSTVQRVSAERIRGEIEAILLAPRPSAGLSLLQETGLLDLLLPELQRCVGVEQRQPPAARPARRNSTCSPTHWRPATPVSRTWSCAGRACCTISARPPPWSAPPDGSLSFHHHDRESARMAHEILERLRSPHSLRDGVSHLVAHHMFNFDEQWSDAAVRRFVARVGRDRIDKLLALRRADQLGRYGEEHRARPSPRLVALAQRVSAVMERREAVTVRDLAVNGSDLMTHLQLAPGPVVGILLRQLLEAVLEDPALNEHDRLLTIAGNLHRPDAAASRRVRPGRASRTESRRNCR